MQQVEGRVSVREGQAGAHIGGTLARRPGLSWFRLLVSLVLAVGLALLVVFFADWNHLKAAIPGFRTQPQLLLVLVGAYTGAFLLRAFAWRALIAGGLSIFRLLVALQAAMLANHLLPFKLGERVRPLVAERSGLPLGQAATTTAVARMLDLIALVAIAAVAGPLVSLSASGGLWVEGLALPAAVVLAGATILLALRWVSLDAWVPALLRERVAEFQSHLRQVSAGRVAHAALWTLPNWVLEAAVLIVAAKAVGVEISIPAAIAVTAFTILFQMFHATPGGIGVYEGVMAGAHVVVRHQTNKGLGAALRTGLATARELDARAAVYVDADGEYSPSQIPDLLAPIDAGEADYVLGSRYLGTIEHQSVHRRVGNMLFTWLLCVAAGRRITDGQTGFRAFSRRALECAEIIHDYNYAQVLTLDLLKKGMRMREVPITYRPRTKGKSFISLTYLWRVPVAMLRQLLST